MARALSVTLIVNLNPPTLIFFHLIGDVDGAKGTVHVCLEQDSTFVNAHLLMAQVMVKDITFIFVTSAALCLTDLRISCFGT